MAWVGRCAGRGIRQWTGVISSFSFFALHGSDLFVVGQPGMAGIERQLPLQGGMLGSVSTAWVLGAVPRTFWPEPLCLRASRINVVALGPVGFQHSTAARIKTGRAVTEGAWLQVSREAWTPRPAERDCSQFFSPFLSPKTQSWAMGCMLTRWATKGLLAAKLMMAG
ncbi:hypothetical protein VTK56DRAFT_4880 [Thermocarpiscus australiensis]